MSPDLSVAVVGAASAAAVTVSALLVARLARLPLAAGLALLVVGGVGAVAAGTTMATRRMYLTEDQLRVVLLVCGASAVVAAGVGLLHARLVVREVAAVRRLATALEDAASAPPSAPGRRPRTTELAVLSAELVETGRRLHESARRERALEQSRRELVAWVSHDLRTPLAGLQALVEALEDGVSPDPAAHLKQVGVEVSRLGDMVSDLFELSRLQAGTGAGRRDALPVGDLVSDTLASLRPIAQQRGVELAGSAEPGLLVAGDAGALLRALANLTGNALRHTPSGGCVFVRGARAGDDVVLEVADGCGGLAPDVLARAFEPGFRGTAARTPGPDSGAGLGLAIVDGIVRAHGGTAEVENTGPGCTFRVRLPVAVDPATPGGTAPAGQTTPQARSTST